MRSVGACGGGAGEEPVDWCSARSGTGWRIIESIHQPMKCRALHDLSSIVAWALTMSHTLAASLRVEFKKPGKKDWRGHKTVIPR